MWIETRNALLERLITCANRQGGFGYRPGTTPFVEPTAIACLALGAQPPGKGYPSDRQTKDDRSLAERLRNRALDWMAKLQQDDGAVAITSEVDSPCWPTSLALLAWLRAEGKTAPPSIEPERKAVDWLLKNAGRRIAWNKDRFGHNTMLAGWPWVSGTHSWVEPTAYAILALRAAGLADHPRCREGVALLFDRCLPGGGWNYGNTRVLTHTLRPFPATTGIALAALVGEPRNSKIEASMTYLTDTLARIRAPLSLGWGLIGLLAWNARPGPAQDWLTSCAARTLRANTNSLHLALLLLAGQANGASTLITTGASYD